MRYHVDRCVYCAQCVQDCPFNCLEMSNIQWKLAALDKAAFTVHYGREDDIGKLLGTSAPANNMTPTASKV